MPRRSSPVIKELRAIRAALVQLTRAFDRLGPVLAASSTVSAGPARRKLKLTPQRRAALKLQGQYMGYMQALKPAQKAMVKSMRATKGIRAAIAAAKRMAA